MNIVDTSVVLKWFVREDGSESAAALMGKMLISPDLLLAELANALWKKVGRREIMPEQARLAMADAGNAVGLLPAAPLADRALSIGLELRHPVYDCFCLALSEQTGARVITADRRFAERCHGTAFATSIDYLEDAPR